VRDPMGDCAYRGSEMHIKCQACKGQISKQYADFITILSISFSLSVSVDILMISIFVY
jgi:hypothetical protein